MEQYLNDVKSELKRADHLFYVSLKYTRTVDVIKSVIQRLLNAFDIGFSAIIDKSNGDDETEVPKQPRRRCMILREKFPEDKELMSYVDLYLELRDIFQAKYGKREEYRRHVTLIAHVTPEKDVEVTIDSLQEYFEKTKRFAQFLAEKIL